MTSLIKHPEQAIETVICEAHGLYIKQVVVPRAFSFAPMHAHVLSHITLLTQGSVHLWIDGEYFDEKHAPTPIYIEAGVKHLFQTLEDNTTFYCVHELTSPQALAILEEHNII